MELSSLAILALVAAAIIVLAIFFTFVPVMLWISALAAGVRISIFTLVGMRLRRVIPSRVVNPLIKAHKAGYPQQQISSKAIIWPEVMSTGWSMP